uniref:Interleukin-1 n=1 Tax=Ctenopharyngodon idella TaxID=7959 RepID=I6UYG8_CTEID|nr:interleukin-1 beta [Ctenopharyngodon idella]
MACERYEKTLASDDASETDSAIYSDSAGFDEMDCSDLPAMSCRCNMHEGIKLEMWRHSTSMKQVVNIIIALERVKNIKPKSSEFGEEEVLNIIMENVIQARRVTAAEATPSYYKTSKTLQCSICDQFKKFLVKSSGSPRLLGVTLRDGNSDSKVRFNLSMYASPSATPNASQPVCLAISKSNLYLACTESDGSSPHLVLKEVTETLNTIKAGDQHDNLLFFRKETGVANNTFESVKYPGWFISTAFKDMEQVEVCQVPSSRITDFTLENK